MMDNLERLKETVEPGVFNTFQEVRVEILAFTSLGISVAINNEYEGLVYKNQVYHTYQVGEKHKAYIQRVREDGRIDVSFQPSQGQHVFSTGDQILAYLEASGGKSEFNDKSSPDDIRKTFKVSKMVFKRAIGGLYKQGKIKLTEHGIELVK